MQLIAIYLILLIHLMDAAIANVALLSITTDLKVDVYQGQWIISAFGIGVVAAIPLVSRLVAWLGSAMALTVMLSASLAALALCGVADSYFLFVLARFLQGVTSGVVVLLMQKLLLTHVGPERSAYGLALWTSAMAISPVLGPVLGAYVINWFDWRWLFIGQVPVLIACCLAIADEFTFTPGGAGERPALTPAILLGAAVFCFEFGLEEALSMERHEPARIAAYFGACAAASAALAWLLRKKALTLFNWSLLANAAYRTYAALSALLAGTVIATSVIYTLWLQITLNLPLLEVAQILASGGLIAGVLSPLIGRMKNKASYPALVWGGVALLILSFFLCTRITASSSMFDMVLPRVIAGFATALYSTGGFLSVAGLEPKLVLEANSLSLFGRIMAGNVFLLFAAEGIKKLERVYSERALADGYGVSLSGVVSEDSVRVAHELLRGASATVAMHSIYWAAIGVLAIMLLVLLFRQLDCPKAQLQAE